MSDQRIRILDEHTINQIAAGEVIENPASVVKELVENALDSGARSVKIETKGGGRGLIRISDDGCGMSQDDLLLSLERHATSKLSQVEDLNTIASLGFRGEALPSIASVSKLSIHTASGEQGRLLQAEGGRILTIKTLPRQQGTTVEVRSLFYNVPVRKNFQKSVGWDRAEIHKILTKMALCHQGIAFSWISEGEFTIDLAAESTLEERAQILLGEEFANSMLPVEHHDASFGLAGLCSRVSFHRPNRTGQYLFVNGRAVVSPFIARKVLEGYGTRLSTHRFPLFVLHLSIPSSLIDVNVHPQKKEIRLREERELEPFLLQAIEKSLAPKKQSTVVMPTDFRVAEPKLEYEPILMKPPEQAEPLLFTPVRRVLAQVGSCLLLEDPEGIRVVNGSAARLRIAYEELMQDEKKKAIQQLLIPLHMEVTGAEKLVMETNLALFEEVGISIRHFGDNTFIVDAIPAFFESEEISTFVHAFLENGDLPKEKKIAIALRKTLKGEARGVTERLVERLFLCQEPDYTPDGKPTHYVLTENTLMQKFR
ncbi:MAG: DNA mismatch repair protein MutL [Chlamydiales bacterium]|nr:DNA mismatch repair protein MutL [Chlamydiales bacterium]